VDRRVHCARVGGWFAPSGADRCFKVPAKCQSLPGTKKDPATATGPQQILVWVADQVAPYKRIRRYELIGLVQVWSRALHPAKSSAADSSSANGHLNTWPTASHTRLNR
jgi:hypothetical protein